MMKQVELRTPPSSLEDTKFVAVVEVLPCLHKETAPGVVLWGSRAFVRTDKITAEFRVVYEEAFAEASLTKPPGLPR